MMKVCIFVAILVASFALVQGQDAAEVETSYGKVKGAMRTSRIGRPFYFFRGIPYGQVPERFQPPQEPAKWDGVKDTSSQPAPACIYFDPLKQKVTGQEDCLNLNIYTPKLPQPNKDKVLLPVVVYLHAGLNEFESSEDYDAKYSMDEDAVIVMVNWRQSVFGFLNTGDMYAAGNQGLRDQVLALKWIQQNIERFSGDKDSVTLMGSSSGGYDAAVHTLSPQSKGLFHKVISMSGYPAIIRNPVKVAKQLGTLVNCPIDSSSALVSCLKTKDAKELLLNIKKVNLGAITKEDIEAEMLFSPTIDKITTEGQTEEDLIIPDHPLNLLAEGKIVNKVPLIIGANEFDGINPFTATLLSNDKLLEQMDKEWNEFAPLLFQYKDTATDKDAVSAKLRNFYLGDKPINRESFLNISNIFMDRFIGYPLVSTAKLYSKVAPVYLYYFSHLPEVGGYKYFDISQNYGMAHLDEVQYLFKIQIEKVPFPEITQDSKEYELSKNLIKLLGSFAETGKPVKTWGEGKEWKSNRAGELVNWYKLGPDTELGPAPEKFVKRVGLWQGLYENELAKEKEPPVVDSF